MNEINRDEVRNQVVNMLGDLKSLTSLYMENDREVAKMKSNTDFSREYKDAEIKKIRDKLTKKVKNTFESMKEHLESMSEVMRENDKVYDFSSSDFISCITLISAAEKPLMLETITGIATKFAGNRQALLALSGVAKERNKDVINKMIFDTETQTSSLQEKVIELEVNFPKSVLMIPTLRDEIVKIAELYGEELKDSEKDLGADYQDIVTMQMRAVMGLSN